MKKSIYVISISWSRWSYPSSLRCPNFSSQLAINNLSGLINDILPQNLQWNHLPSASVYAGPLETGGTGGLPPRFSESSNRPLPFFAPLGLLCGKNVYKSMSVRVCVCVQNIGVLGITYGCVTWFLPSDPFDKKSCSIFGDLQNWD